MKESYDISVLFKIFKMFLKSGPSSNLRRKNDDKWVKMAGPESSINTLLTNVLITFSCLLNGIWPICVGVRDSSKSVLLYKMCDVVVF